MPSPGVAERLLALEERLERLERLAYLSYVETRAVAQYAYETSLLDDDEAARRMKGMKALSDGDALRAGLEPVDLIVLKHKQRFLVERCRQDALAIAKELADERKRRPVVPQEDEAEEAA